MSMLLISTSIIIYYNARVACFLMPLESKGEADIIMPSGPADNQ